MMNFNYQDRVSSPSGMPHLNTHDEEPEIMAEMAQHLGSVMKPRRSPRQRTMLEIAAHNPSKLSPSDRGVSLAPRITSIP